MELRIWTLFVDMVKNCLCNRQGEKYKYLMEKLLKSLQDLGANMSIKVNFLQNHIDEFLDNYSDVTDGKGGRFRQDIKTTEERY